MPPINRTSPRHPIVPAMALSIVTLMLAQCDRASDQQTASPPAKVPEAPKPAVSSSPRPAAALSRAELIAATAQAASTYAQGMTSTGTDPLVGRSFAVRIPFGCSGPSVAGEGAENRLAGWSWGPDQKTIEIRLTPGDWTASALMPQSGGQGGSPAHAWESVEGFWIPRPWLSAEACPKVAGDPLQTLSATSPQTLGIAAVFQAGGSRIGRRNGRAYSFTVRGQGDQPVSAPAEGYRLVLEGRIVGFPTGRAIRCLASGPDQRPVCVVATQLDKVAFEDAAGGVLSVWQSS